ncbi:MAG: undecaprenyldiphospho-muramoylpentapeptide beta-N-acetylglucosaminyltransferase [Candidatus Margulisiibacteriota bacterium]
MKVLICAAGTGGHIYPAVAVAQQLQKELPSVKLLFLTSSKEVEDIILKAQPYATVRLPLRGFQKGRPLDYLPALFSVISGFIRVFQEMKRFDPDAVFSTGGYMSLPCCLAAFLLGKRIVLHEQNVLPGRGIRSSSRFARITAVSFEESLKYFKSGRALLTGNPVREQVLTSSRDIAAKALGLDPSRRTLLVTGGSQGSVSINSLVVKMLPFLSCGNYNLVHITGSADFDRVKKAVSGLSLGGTFYRCYPFLQNIWDALASADLVLSRAGATMISELACKNLPSILIPYPYSAEGHQELNARALEKKGACFVGCDDSLSPEKISDMIIELMGDDNALKKMGRAAGSFYRQDAAKKITELILEDL